MNADLGYRPGIVVELLIVIRLKQYLNYDGVFKLGMIVPLWLRV